ncbi:MAG: 23S rRNA (pseudouridine(1915)-N(3))-methyltransferase RlmH [Saprospiraceae bacterium]
MKIRILCIGKTNEPYLLTGVKLYLDRLKHYTSIEFDELKDIKVVTDPEQLKLKEAELIQSKLKPDDIIVLLDENGQEFSSVKFSNFIEQKQLHSTKNLIFIIGGAFGHHDTLKKNSHHVLSLSKMTFSHQMVRLILVEQIYRAFTIIRNEKYHNI